MNKRLTTWAKRFILIIILNILLIVLNETTIKMDLFRYFYIGFLSWSITGLIYELNISRHLLLKKNE